MSFHDAAARAAAAIQALPAGSRWFLATDVDADGLAAAAVMSKALHRAGYAYTVRASRDKSLDALMAVVEQDVDGVMFLDKASGHADVLAARAGELGRRVLIIDHHNLPKSPVPDGPALMVNPRAEGLDGSQDACASTTALAVALALGGDRNLDLGPSSLVGAIGDWQHVRGWQGWNRQIVERCLESGHLVEKPAPRLGGGPLASAVARYKHVPVPGLTGDVAGSAAFLEGLGFNPEDPIDSLDDDGLTRLMSVLVARQLLEGAETGDVQRLVGALQVHAHLQLSLRAIFGIVDACGREGRSGLGLAFLMGDREAARGARSVYADYRRAIRKGLERLQREGTTRLAALQWAWTDRPAYTGMVAGLGINHVLQDVSVPVVMLAKRDDALVQISHRGEAHMVDAGLDLGVAVQAAALQAGGEGGGHPVAAGAVIPEDQVDGYLAALDKVLQEQGFAPMADKPA